MTLNPPETPARAWLLEHENPGVRYLALRDLAHLPPADPALLEARAKAHREGPIAEVLAAMQPEGWWERPGPGYNPKYRSTVWAVTLLAQLGARVEQDERVGRACAYLLEHNLNPGGQFSTGDAPSGTVDCLQGNLCWALIELGCADPRLERAYDWMARTVTGEDLAPNTERDAPARYYAYKCGPLFACGANYNQPCAWGAAKVLLALGRLPLAQRTPVVQRAAAAGIDFLFSVDPAGAGWPSGPGGRPSQSWWKFGFPVFYVTDLLQIAEALVGLGCAADPRLGGLLELIRRKQDAQGRWALEYTYEGKTWGGYGAKKAPNPWVTLRALRVLEGGKWGK